MIASQSKPGTVTKYGEVTKVIPMTGFSVIQFKVEGRAKPIIVKKDALVN